MVSTSVQRSNAHVLRGKVRGFLAWKWFPRLRASRLSASFEKGRSPLHQLPGNACSMFGSSHFSVGPEGASHLSPLGQYDDDLYRTPPSYCPLGQYDGGVLYKSSGQFFLKAPLYSSRAPLEVGSAQLALAESNACVGQTEPGCRHAISEQCPLRRVDAPPTNGSGNMGNIRQARSRPLHLRRQQSLPNLILEGQGRDWPMTGPTTSFMLFPRLP